MVIDLKAEERKMKNTSRSIGEKTGIGFGGNEDGEDKEMSNKQKQKFDVKAHEEMINLKIMREA